jgi:hypothetical protein
MLLALHEVAVDPRAIENYIPSHREGMSLLELQDATTALGLRTEVRRCSFDELRRAFESPVIAYVVDRAPHFVVVVDVTEDSVTVLDGTTGERRTLTSQTLNNIWSGYVLAPASGLSVFWLFLAIAPCALLLGGLTVRGFFKRTPEAEASNPDGSCTTGLRPADVPTS